MSLLLFDGTCPACAMEGRALLMRANSECMAECPTCHLQAELLNGRVVIWHVLGRGDFNPPPYCHYSAGEWPSPVTLSEHNNNWPRGAGRMIETREHLAAYVAAVKSGLLPDRR